MNEEKTIGNYKLKHLIGKGSISSVYLATDSNEQEIALKVMRESPFIENRVLEHILENAEVAIKMPAHPKITHILEFGKSDDAYFIAMTLIRGPGTLENLISQKYFDINSALLLSLDIAEALSHAHNSNIVHGDLKPGNVLINENNEAILNDFGSVTSGPSNSLKFGQSLIGTPKYMSPEQAKGMYISQSSDIYSFGVLLYEMLTYELPYRLDPGTNIQKMIKLITESTPIPPREFNKMISRDLSTLLLKLLAKDDEAKFETILQVSRELKLMIEQVDNTGPDSSNMWSKFKNLF